LLVIQTKYRLMTFDQNVHHPWGACYRALVF
jgi:hypothetical protein